MKPSDFKIGMEFICGPFWWRCTDIGTRTVTAIRLVEDDSVWYEGPPYMIEEVVLDEAELDDAHLTEEDAIRASIDEADTSWPPGFPQEAVMRMMDVSIEGEPYPRKPLLRFNRLRADGEILHPYAGRKVLDGWLVCLYLPFTQEWAEIPEREFLDLTIAGEAVVRERTNRQ
ncbi:hypothetical protein [Paraburkholderia adhaesiva]|uniref:hypothetical protein n=1 Tax=Paraburkholderia adhaesiva TaxID=2883244 RepID=UPI001F3DCAA0|nr:hypothetical protein [Paraburkholderia adhaesiva]